MKSEFDRRMDERLREIRKEPGVKELLRELRQHFKKEGWELHYEPQLWDLRQAGCHEVYAAALLASEGYKIVYSAKTRRLVVRK